MQAVFNNSNQEVLENFWAKVWTKLDATSSLTTLSAPIIRFSPRDSDVLEALVEFKANGVLRCAKVRISGKEIATLRVGTELVGLLVERTAAAILAALSQK